MSSTHGKEQNTKYRQLTLETPQQGLSVKEKRQKLKEIKGNFMFLQWSVFTILANSYEHYTIDCIAL